MEIGSDLGGFTFKLAERFEHIIAIEFSPERVCIIPFAGKNHNSKDTFQRN
jgi:16S rRNA A1518/A1519 N6-dimethyltransferase RsmA/KsgA/DIM1 with predicted DNA glycosylase/AP lyase activity